MAKLTFVLLAVVAVVVLATTELSAKSVEGKNFIVLKSVKISVGASCECNECTSKCVEEGYDAGYCYKNECQCTNVY